MNDYGFTTDEVAYDPLGLPVGVHKVLVVDEELKDQPDKPNNPRVLIAEYEIVEGQHKGKRQKVWYNIDHTNPQAKNIARQQLKRIADATGKPVSPSTPLKGRAFVVEVRQQKNDETRTEIFKYHSEDYKPDSYTSVPV